jgi:hypothetical protein
MVLEGCNLEAWCFGQKLSVLTIDLGKMYIGGIRYNCFGELQLLVSNLGSQRIQSSCRIAILCGLVRGPCGWCNIDQLTRCISVRLNSVVYCEVDHLVK